MRLESISLIEEIEYEDYIITILKTRAITKVLVNPV